MNLDPVVTTTVLSWVACALGAGCVLFTLACFMVGEPEEDEL